MRRTIMTLVVAAAAALGAAVLFPAAGQPRVALCGDYAPQVAFLAEVHGETLVAVGTTTGGVIIEIFASAGGATWTLISRHEGGRYCLEGAGIDWTPVTPQHPSGAAKGRDG